jgi:hypothetical protein
MTENNDTIQTPLKNLFEDCGNFHDEEKLKKSYDRLPDSTNIGTYTDPSKSETKAKEPQTPESNNP